VSGSGKPPANEMRFGWPRNASTAAIPSPTSPRVRAANNRPHCCRSCEIAISPTIENSLERLAPQDREEKAVSDSMATHYRWEDLPREALKPDLARRLISTERMMLAQVYLDKGCVVPRHSHENEQLTYIVDGLLRFWLGEDESETVDVAAGEVLHLPSNLPHKAEALETTLDIDIFCPPRQDWLDGADAYLRDK